MRPALLPGAERGCRPNNWDLGRRWPLGCEMPRLILIEGPRSGDSWKLAGENYLGYRNGAIAFSYQNDLGQPWALVRGNGERYEIANLGPRDRVQVNGEGAQKA